MELKAGTYYKTREGKKAYVAACVQGSRDHIETEWDGAPFYGDIYGNCSCLERWRKDGSSCTGSRINDLIEEWKEPKRIKVWVNVWVSDRGEVYSSSNTTKDSYDSEAILLNGKTDRRLIARFSHEVEEGENI